MRDPLVGVVVFVPAFREPVPRNMHRVFGTQGPRKHPDQ